VVSDPFTPDPDQPQWFKRFRQRMQDAAFQRGGNPVSLAPFKSTALPDPVKFRGCLINVIDLSIPAYSDGSAWYRITLGSAI
jgi:hypothetical protein